MAPIASGMFMASTLWHVHSIKSHTCGIRCDRSGRETYGVWLASELRITAAWITILKISEDGSVFRISIHSPLIAS